MLARHHECLNVRLAYTVLWDKYFQRLIELAGTVVYASCVGTDEQKSQIDIANAADVTEVTIRVTIPSRKKREIIRSKYKDVKKADRPHEIWEVHLTHVHCPCLKARKYPRLAER